MKITESDLITIGASCAEFVRGCRLMLRKSKNERYRRTAGATKKLHAKSPVTRAKRLISLYGERDAWSHTDQEDVRTALAEVLFYLRHARRLAEAVKCFKVGDRVQDSEGGSRGVVEAVDPDYGTCEVRVNATEVLSIDGRYLEVCQS